MENKSIIGIIVAIVAIALVGILIGKGGKKEIEEPVVATVEQGEKLVDGTYTLMAAGNIVTWHAEKTGGSHTGAISAIPESTQKGNKKSSTLVVKNGVIVSGNITMDMKTIINTDGDENKKLVDHLKSADFFDVVKYPTATLEFSGYDTEKSITKVTIKGVTKNIDKLVFDAKPTEQDGGNLVDLKSTLALANADFGIGQSVALKAMLKGNFTLDVAAIFALGNATGSM